MIKLWMTVEEFQTAYQKGKSCNNQLFTIRTIAEQAKKKGTPIFILFVDLEKAFNRVRRTTLLSSLMKAGMGSNMLRALKSLYSCTKIVLNKIGRLTPTSGIRQGTASSADIFIISVNGLFKHLREIYGDNPITGKIHNLIHADDTVALATEYEALISKVKSTIQFFDTIKQNINLSKTKYMCIDRTGKYTKHDIHVDSIQIE